MTGNTTNEGFPYPLVSDFADVQDAFRLATAIDSQVRAEQAPMRAFIARPSFIARQTVNGSTFTSGQQDIAIGAIDWDNTAGLTLGGSSWRQPNAQAPSWWLFGATMFVSASAPVVGDAVVAKLTISTSDQVTGVTTSTPHYQRNDESNTNGEWINVFSMGAVYRGSASLRLLLNGSTAKGILAGTRLWGMYLGPVT